MGIEVILSLTGRLWRVLAHHVFQSKKSASPLKAYSIPYIRQREVERVKQTQTRPFAFSNNRCVRSLQQNSGKQADMRSSTTTNTNTISIHRPQLLRFPHDAAVVAANHIKFQRVTTASWTMWVLFFFYEQNNPCMCLLVLMFLVTITDWHWDRAMDSKKSSSFGNCTSKKNKKEELSIIPHLESSSSSSDFRFDRLQPSDQELGTDQKRLEFGHYVARQALLDEEFWVYYIFHFIFFIFFFETTFFY